jgi:hypothetical protein
MKELPEPTLEGQKRLAADPLIAAIKRGDIAAAIKVSDYFRGMEDAAQIADEWVKYTNCPGHDNDPCCHVRTAAAIAAKIREQMRREEI